MQNRIKILIIFLLLILQTNLFAGITVSTKIDTSIATIGDQINLSITVEYPDESTIISFPELNDELQKLSLISKEALKPEKLSDGFQNIYQLKIAVFDTGKVEIPSLTVEIQSDSADAITFKTSTHIVNVISVLPPQEDVKPKDIKLPFPLPTILPWDIIILIAVLLGISILWFFWYKRWKKNNPKVDFNEKYLDPPHIIALRKLNQIRTLPFSTEKEIIKTYTNISYIFREYLENRFFIRALEMPTREILECNEILDIDNTTTIEMNDILNRLDIIKFANQLPEIAEKDNILSISEKIINNTKIDNFLSQESEDIIVTD